MIILLALFINSSLAEEPPVIYEYKKYEKFDLGDLEVKGQLIAPGDISVRERERKVFELDLFKRTNVDEFILNDIKSFR